MVGRPAKHSKEAFSAAVRYEKRSVNVQTDSRQMPVFQLAYTSIFGFHAAFLFLRTGSAVPPILAHIFCNIMGFPRPADAVHRRPSQRYGEEEPCAFKQFPRN